MADDATSASPSTGASPTAVDPWAMTPEQATAYLEQKSAQYAAQSARQSPLRRRFRTRTTRSCSLRGCHAIRFGREKSRKAREPSGWNMSALLE